MIFFAAIGVILGGRLGWILFYGAEQAIDDPLTIVRIWEGGMSFHGGLIGVHHRRVDLRTPTRTAPRGRPRFSCAAARHRDSGGPHRQLHQRRAVGQADERALGVHVDPALVHPTQAAEAQRLCERFSIDPCVLHVHASQLYEGLLEGLALFVILWWFTSKPRPRLAPAGLFLICYGIFRFAVEFVRVPDENRGYLLFDWVTMGQILSRQ